MVAEMRHTAERYPDMSYRADPSLHGAMASTWRRRADERMADYDTDPSR